ncbi:MAG: hypothetical protein EHM39_00365 [Chloroflexi bacterium]|nr:MAG: hypothetical protein EHM39_00365 [Chloroflexota bacterium]
MAAKVQNGKVIFRRWDRHAGLDETSRSFVTLDDLFELCLQANDPLLVDRVTIEGKDATGAPRVVTLVFQSVTVSDHQDPGRS